MQLFLAFQIHLKGVNFTLKCFFTLYNYSLIVRNEKKKHFVKKCFFFMVSLKTKEISVVNNNFLKFLKVG